jgi:hypothetical protein
VARRSPAAACDSIAAIAQELALLLEDAADAGSRQSGNGFESNGRGRGFADSDPTGTAAWILAERRSAEPPDVPPT